MPDPPSHIVNRPIVNRPIVNRPIVNRPIVNRPIVNRQDRHDGRLPTTDDTQE